MLYLLYESKKTKNSPLGIPQASSLLQKKKRIKNKE